MRRTVSARLELEIREQAGLVLQIATAAGAGQNNDQFTIALDRTPPEPLEVAGTHGTRAHVLAVASGRPRRRPHPATAVGHGASLTCGDNERLRRPRLVGSGLELDGALLQLSVFTSDGGAERAFGRIARPSRRR